MNTMNQRMMSSDCCPSSNCMNQRNMRFGMNNARTGCSCNSSEGCDANSSMHNDAMRGMPVGMGYVPWQQWECVYTLEEGLSKGTIFPSLNLPFYGCIPRGYYCKGGQS